MLSWLRSRRERAERIDAKAKALIRAFGADAYSEARHRERQADNEAMAREWGRVALAVARLTGKRVGFDTATRMTMDADFTSDPKAGHSPSVLSSPEGEQIDELKRILGER